MRFLKRLFCKHRWRKTNGGNLERCGSSMTAGTIIGWWREEKCLDCGAVRERRKVY